MTIQVYVGTDARSEKADRVLAHSIRKHCSMPVEIHWMRQGDPGFHGWVNQPEMPHPPHGWATGFTCFRYAVPELAGFQGRAIYLDSDMVVLGDLAELWHWPTRRPWFCSSSKRTDVSVIDCGAFRDFPEWPPLKTMKTEGIMGHLMRTILGRRIEAGLPEEWNSMDHYEPGVTKLLHFTRMDTQPWEPWPDRFNYQPHKDKGAVKLFWQMYEEAVKL